MRICGQAVADDGDLHESVDVEPAPLRLVLGSQALQSTIDTLKRRLEGFEAQRELAASTDFPAGE